MKEFLYTLFHMMIVLGTAILYTVMLFIILNGTNIWVVIVAFIVTNVILTYMFIKDTQPSARRNKRLH